MTKARLSWTKLAPKAYQAMASVGASLATSTPGLPLMELIKTGVSQINGSSFCVDMHARDLRKQCET